MYPTLWHWWVEYPLMLLSHILTCSQKVWLPSMWLCNLSQVGRLWNCTLSQPLESVTPSESHLHPGHWVIPQVNHQTTRPSDFVISLPQLWPKDSMYLTLYSSKVASLWCEEMEPWGTLPHMTINFDSVLKGKGHFEEAIKEKIKANMEDYGWIFCFEAKKWSFIQYLLYLVEGLHGERNIFLLGFQQENQHCVMSIPQPCLVSHQDCMIALGFRFNMIKFINKYMEDMIPLTKLWLGGVGYPFMVC